MFCNYNNVVVVNAADVPSRKTSDKIIKQQQITKHVLQNSNTNSYELQKELQCNTCPIYINSPRKIIFKRPFCLLSDAASWWLNQESP